MMNPESTDESIAWFAEEDPGMREAIQRAQDSFPKFEAELVLESRRIVPAMEECLMKYAFPARKGSGVQVEHMFLSDVFHNGSEVVGTLASDPEYTDGVEAGDEIVVERRRVSDWLYVINGKPEGGFTFLHMWQGFSKQEKKMYRDEPPFCWLGVK